MLFCLQMTAGTHAPAWKGSLPPDGRGLLKAVPCFPTSVFSLFLACFLPQLFSLSVTPVWSTGLWIFSELGRALPAGQEEAIHSSHPCSSRRHTYRSDSSLVISHVKPEDAGTYTCIISDGRTERRQIQLQIIGNLPST